MQTASGVVLDLETHRGQLKWECVIAVVKSAMSEAIHWLTLRLITSDDEHNQQRPSWSLSLALTATVYYSTHAYSYICKDSKRFKGECGSGGVLVNMYVIVCVFNLSPRQVYQVIQFATNHQSPSCLINTLTCKLFFCKSTNLISSLNSFILGFLCL